MAESQTAEPVRWFGNYSIVRRVTEGAMGIIYEGRDAQGGKVAIKTPISDTGPDDPRRKRFLQEGSMLSRACSPHPHPNLPLCCGYAQAYIAMEWVEGVTLATYLRQRGRIPPEQAIEIVRQVCLALERLAELEIVHRDVKPENIMLVIGREMQPGWVKLVDLGIAKDLKRDDGPTTHDGGIVGTPLYMAPEQLAGDLVDERADLYAVGVVLHLLLTGRDLYPSGDRVLDIIAVRKKTTVPRLAPTGVSERLWEVVRAALEKDVMKRIPSAREFITRLDEAMRIGAAHAPTSPAVSATRLRPFPGRTPPPTRVAAPPSQKNTGVRAVAGLSVLGVIMAVLLVMGIHFLTGRRGRALATTPGTPISVPVVPGPVADPEPLPAPPSKQPVHRRRAQRRVVLPRTPAPAPAQVAVASPPRPVVTTPTPLPSPERIRISRLPNGDYQIPHRSRWPQLDPDDRRRACASFRSRRVEEDDFFHLFCDGW